jgi:WD40 repeat protein
VVFPVNAVAYHPGFGTFATGGGDGVVNIWDGNNKKRLFQVRVGVSSIGACTVCGRMAYSLWVRGAMQPQKTFS